MCLFNTPAAATTTKTIAAPVKTNVIDTATDSAATAAAKEKQRRGYQSTVATTGSGLFDQATTKKVTLGS